MKKEAIEVIHVTSGQKIAVRTKSNRNNYFKLKNCLNEWFYTSGTQDKLRNFSEGQVCAIYGSCGWHRAKIIKNHGYEKQVLLRLVDDGRDELCSVDELFELPQMFLEHRAFSFNIHLVHVSSGKDTEAEEIKKLLPQNNQLFLIPRGNPVIIDEGISLPAEISWEAINDEIYDPFSEEIAVKEVYLSQYLMKEGILKLELYDDDVEENETTQNLELMSAILMHQPDISMEESKFSSKSVPTRIRWLDPMLPSVREFYAYGTHVDDSGQIYIYLHSERKNFRKLIRQLEQFNEIVDDDDIVCQDLVYHEDLLAKWHKDDKWYRARFIEYYPNSNKSKCAVLFVDWGNISLIETKNVRRETCSPEVPIFTFKVSLHNVLSSNENWSMDALDFIFDQVNNNRLKVKTMSRRNRQPLLVDIKLLKYNQDNHLKEKEVFVSLADLLIERDEAVKATLTDIDSTVEKKKRKKHNHGVGFCKPEVRKLSSIAKIEQKFYSSTHAFSDIPDFDLETINLLPGSLVECKVKALLTWNQFTVHLPSLSNYDSLSSLMMKHSPSSANVPILRKGMTLAMFHDNLKDWVRVEVLECPEEASEIYLKLIDFGTEEWIELNYNDSQFKCLPDEVCNIPRQAIMLLLSIGADTSSDENQSQSLLKLMTDSVCYSARTSDFNFLIRIRNVTESSIHGHLLDENQNYAYRKLIKDKLIMIL